MPHITVTAVMKISINFIFSEHTLLQGSQSESNPAELTLVISLRIAVVFGIAPWDMCSEVFPTLCSKSTVHTLQKNIYCLMVYQTIYMHHDNSYLIRHLTLWQPYSLGVKLKIKSYSCQHKSFQWHLLITFGLDYSRLLSG